MITVTSPKKTEPLNGNDKATIAAVLTWDLCKPVTPEEIEGIRINGDWVAVRLSCDRAVPIHREIFRAILQQQRQLTKKGRGVRGEG